MLPRGPCSAWHSAQEDSKPDSKAAPSPSAEPLEGSVPGPAPGSKRSSGAVARESAAKPWPFGPPPPPPADRDTDAGALQWRVDCRTVGLPASQAAAAVLRSMASGHPGTRDAVTTLASVAVSDAPVLGGAALIVQSITPLPFPLPAAERVQLVAATACDAAAVEAALASDKPPQLPVLWTEPRGVVSAGLGSAPTALAPGGADPRAAGRMRLALDAMVCAAARALGAHSPASTPARAATGPAAPSRSPSPAAPAGAVVTPTSSGGRVAVLVASVPLDAPGASSGAGSTGGARLQRVNGSTVVAVIPTVGAGPHSCRVVWWTALDLRQLHSGPFQGTPNADCVLESLSVSDVSAITLVRRSIGGRMDNDDDDCDPPFVPARPATVQTAPPPKQPARPADSPSCLLHSEAALLLPTPASGPAAVA